MSTASVRNREVRSPVLFTLGLVIAAILAIGLDSSFRVFNRVDIERDSAQLSELNLPTRLLGQLSPAERAAAKSAWFYLSENTEPLSGFVNSVAGFPSTTMWDQGSYLMGLVSAYRLELVDQNGFDARIRLFLNSLKNIPLFEGKLPNKVYNTQTLQMTNYANDPIENGIGWSALDMARMLLALRVLERNAPEFGKDIRTVLAGWDLTAIAKDGDLIGASVIEGQVKSEQEGRIGYEQYAARAAAMWGLDVGSAMSSRRVLGWRTILGTEVPIDLRSFRGFQTINPTLSEPYLLMGLEIGFDAESYPLAKQIYQAQENRYLTDGILTAVSEDHIDQAPHFLYNSVFAVGHDWAVVAENGTNYPELRTLSTKASFGWHALFDTEYTALLVDEITQKVNIQSGWPAGVYEATGEVNAAYTLNTNAVILEAISYMANGPLWHL